MSGRLKFRLLSEGDGEEEGGEGESLCAQKGDSYSPIGPIDERASLVGRVNYKAITSDCAPLLTPLIMFYQLTVIHSFSSIGNKPLNCNTGVAETAEEDSQPHKRNDERAKRAEATSVQSRRKEL